MKRVLTIALLYLCGMGASARAEGVSQHFPEISGYTLEGERLSLPADLASPATLIVIVEEDPFADDLASWRELSGRLEGEVPALFLVTMGDKRGLSRSIAAGRLRAEVGDPDLRSDLIPVFENGSELRGGLGIASSSRVSAVLVSKSGEVIWRARGPAGEAAIEELRSSLRVPLQQTQPAVEPAATLIGQAALTVPEAIAPPTTAAVPLPAPAPAPAPEPLPLPSSPTGDEVALEPPYMPEIDGVTLAGRSLSMPGDFGKTGSRLILVPDYAGHDVLVSALSEAAADADDASPWYVLLFMGKSPRFGKAVAAGRLRAKLELPLWREHVIPVYMELSTFEQLAGLESGTGTRIVRATQDGALSPFAD